MTKAHLEQRLKDLQGALELYNDVLKGVDPATENGLLTALLKKIERQEGEINEVKKQIEDFQLTLVRIDNIFHEPIQFDVREEGGK